MIIWSVRNSEIDYICEYMSSSALQTWANNAHIFHKGSVEKPRGLAVCSWHLLICYVLYGEMTWTKVWNTNPKERKRLYNVYIQHWHYCSVYHDILPRFLTSSSTAAVDLFTFFGVSDDDRPEGKSPCFLPSFFSERSESFKSWTHSIPLTLFHILGGGC